MIEYKLIGKNNHPITRYDYDEISKTITSIFPEMPLEINKRYGLIIETRGSNGDAFHLFCRDRDTRIFIPSKDEKSIKEKLEVIAEYKFEEVKCQ